MSRHEEGAQMKRCCLCNKVILFHSHKLNNKHCICHNCIDKLPKELSEQVLHNYSREDLSILDSYISKINPKFSAIFTPTDTFGGISLDKEHSLFKLSDSFMVYSIDNLTKCQFVFDATNMDDCLDFKLLLKSEKPRIKLELTLVQDIRVAKVSDFNVGNDFVSALPLPAK